MIGYCRIQQLPIKIDKTWLNELWMEFLLPTKRIILVTLISWHFDYYFLFIYLFSHFQTDGCNFKHSLLDHSIFFTFKRSIESSTNCTESRYGISLNWNDGPSRVNYTLKMDLNSIFFSLLIRFTARHFALCQQSVWIW